MLIGILHDRVELREPPMSFASVPAMITFAPWRAARCWIGTLGVALVLSASSPATPAAHAAAPAPGAVPLMGVNIPDVEPGPLADADRMIAQAQALHATVVRTRVPWSVLQPAAPNAIDPRSLAFMDRLVSDAASSGIRVLMFVESTPCWASSASPAVVRACGPGDSSEANRWPPSQPAAYGSFAAFLARRYGSNLAAIEVWNEPDHANQHWFAGPEKAQRYAALLRAAYVAVKQANPAVPVLGGSLVGSNGEFLRALYAAGIKGYYDGLAVHYYNLTLGSVRSIHEVQLANHDTKPLWLDEFGWTSCFPRQRIQAEQACVTTRLQALNLSDTIRTLSRVPYMAAIVDYTLNDSRSEDFGAVAVGGSRKPSFSALSRVFASPFGRVSHVGLSLRRVSGRVLAKGSGPVGDFLQLEAFRGGVLRYRALFVLDRFNRFSIPLPRVLGTRGLSVRVWQYWQGPGGAARRTI